MMVIDQDTGQEFYLRHTTAWAEDRQMPSGPINVSTSEPKCGGG